MIFSANTQELIEGLNVVTHAIPARAANKSMECVLMESFDNELSLTCTDGSVIIQTYVKAEISESGKVLLPGKLLSDLIRRFPDSTVNFNINASHIASIRCRSTRSNISGLSAVEFPDLQDLSSDTTVIIPQNILKNMINKTVFSASTVDSKQTLTGVLWEISEEEFRMVALDGFRLSLQVNQEQYSVKNFVQNMKAIIPSRILNEIGKSLSDSDAPCSIQFEKNRVKFNFNRYNFISVLLSGDFMDYRRIIPDTFKTQVEINKTVLEESIERASLLAREGKSNIIKMSIQEESLIISSRADQGDFMEELQISLHGDPINIAFNPKYILDVIRNIPDDIMIMNMNSNVSPLIVTNKSEIESLYLILPVRV